MRDPTTQSLQIDPFGQRQGIIQINAELAHSAVHFGMPQEKLHGLQIAGLLENPDNLGAPPR